MEFKTNKNIKYDILSDKIKLLFVWSAYFPFF